MKRLLAILVLSLALCFTISAKEVTLLFTHDLHSRILPVQNNGGYARLMSAIEAEKNIAPDALLVDGGDFSMGSLFQTAFASSAIELRMMGEMGYDVTTLGNHEFDYLPSGLISMLNVAKNYNVPEIVLSNYHTENADMQAALNNYGVREYTVIERDGVCFVIFGIFGYDAHECAPNSNMTLEEPKTAANRIVNEAVAYCRDTLGKDPVVICLSHSGTVGGVGEDYDVANAVNGIDVIISAHTHTTLNEPIIANDTLIVSAGEYGKNLGVLKFDFEEYGKTALKEYRLVSINQNVPENERIAALAEDFKTEVNEKYLAEYGMSFDKVLTSNSYTFDTDFSTQRESTLGNLFSDAYKWAVESTTGETVDAALTAVGVIRDTIPLGDVTVSDVFNAASLGVGTEGELVAIYVTGKDLKTAFEVDASVQPLMSSAQLFFSGAEYSFNTNRMIFNKVDYAMLRRNDGTLEKIDNEKLYLVVTGMYCGQMLGAVEKTSYGLISITPRDKDGNPVAADELVNYVVKDKNGKPLKEWYAISAYLEEMGGEMDNAYAENDGRKIVYSSFSPIALLRNANVFTYAVLIILLIIIAAVILIVFAVIKKIKKKKMDC